MLAPRLGEIALRYRLRPCGVSRQTMWRATKVPQKAANRTDSSNTDRRFQEFKDLLAEGVGFEPTVRIAHNGFRDRPDRPLRHPSAGGPRP